MFLDGIPARVSPRELRDLLCLGESSWKVLSEYKRPESPGRSRYETLTVSIGDYHHLNVKGELILEFLNERLTDAYFYAEDIPRYKMLLKKRYHIEFTPHYPQVGPIPGKEPDEWEGRLSYRIRITIVEVYRHGRNALCAIWYDRSFESEQTLFAFGWK